MRQVAEKENDNDRGNRGVVRSKRKKFVNQSKHVLLTLLYSLQTAEVMKISNNE